MDCGGFYGRVRPLVTPISTPFRRTSDTSTSMASGSTSMGDVAELFSRDLADGTPQRRGARTLEQKLDSVLQALEQQKDDNAALKSQLRVLEEKFDNCNGSNNSSGSANKKARIPSSLSVSALCFLFNFLFNYYLYT